MTVRVFSEDILIEKLEDHDITCFECSDEDLTDFLRSDAKVQMEFKMNTTYVCIYDKLPVAYVTLASDSIRINKEDEERIGLKYGSYPALKIGRLAVDQKYAKLGIGTLIIYWVVGLAMDLCSQIGIRFISVDSYRESKEFYEKLLFVELAETSKRNVPMYTDLIYW